MAEASLDGQGYAKEEEILRIDTEIRKRLNLPIRCSSMVQPYTREKKTPEHEIQLRYRVESSIEIETVSLALREENKQGLCGMGFRFLVLRQDGMWTKRYKKLALAN